MPAAPYVVVVPAESGATVHSLPDPSLESAQALAASLGEPAEVVSQASAEALIKNGRGLGADPAGGMRVGDFKLAIAEAYLNVAGTDPATQAKWDRLFALLATNPNDKVVYPAEMPLAGILLTGVQDGILSAATAQALGVTLPV